MFYFTSDLHFGSDKILKSDGRPFKNHKDFENQVIKIWNKQAKKGDTIFVLGDFVDCKNENHKVDESLELVKKIKANVVLIAGNNEDRAVKFFFNNSFEEFCDYCIKKGFKEVYHSLSINFKNQDFYLVHKPLHCKPDIINIFGHIHRAGGIYRPFGVNVCCDLNSFRLYSEDDILDLLKLKETYWDVDKNMNFFQKIN